jgi:WD40 repeat protein
MRTKPSARIPLALALACSTLAATAQIGPDIVWVTNAHYAAVSSVAFSGDSMRLASGSYDEHATVWSVESASLVRSVFTFNELVLAIDLDSDGNFLATGTDEGIIRLWDVSNGFVQWQNGANQHLINSIAFSKDDSLIVEGRDGPGELLLHDVSTGFGTFLEGDGEPIPGINSAVFSPDGGMVASCGDESAAKLWDVSSHGLIRTFIGGSGPLYSVAFSPDGKKLATAGDAATARLWNVETGDLIAVLEDAGYIAKFSANGSLLISLDFVNNGLFKIWRVSNGAFLGSYPNTSATAFDIASNGKYFAYGRNDGALVLARMPLVVDSVANAGNQTVIHWQGGSGLYQVQQCTNMGTAFWQNVGGPTTNTSATNNMPAGNVFYRLQSLPNP